MLEGAGFKKTVKKIIQGTEKRWNLSIRPVLKIAAPIISAGVAAETKNPQSVQSTSNILKSITGGKICRPLICMGAD